MKKKKSSKVLDESLEGIVRVAIIDSGLTMYRIAKDSDVSQAQISRFVSGDRGLTLDSAGKICKVLGLSLSIKSSKTDSESA